MDFKHYVCLYFYFMWTLHKVSGSEFINYDSLGDFSEHPGHLKPFGASSDIQVDEIIQAPDPVTFYQEYILQDRPVKIKQAVVDHPAFTTWTDDHFLNLDIPHSTKVDVEYHKKEIRGLPLKRINFKMFVRTHRSSKLYMIEPVPDFLRKDLRLPFCLQCDEMVGELIDQAMIWFSGGGTSSVVHSDTYHNLNCVYRGTKHFVLINPDKYLDLAHIDRPEGGYSSVDVDSVDMNKYPGLTKVEYIHAHIEAGDCLYIPYAWIHQVRSYDSNIATNIWWHGSDNFDLTTCNTTYDTSYTLENLRKRETGIFMNFHQVVTTELRKAVDNQLPGDQIMELVIPDISQYHGNDFFKREVDDVKSISNKIMDLSDPDGNGMVTMDEILNMPDEKSTQLIEQLQRLEEVFQTIDMKLQMGDEPRDEAGQLLHNRDEL